MKILAFLSPLRPHPTLTATSIGHVSFAEFMAAGRNVKTISGERAFGFSETGIFGACRSLSKVDRAHVGAVALDTMADSPATDASDTVPRPVTRSASASVVERPATMRTRPLDGPIAGSQPQCPVAGIESVGFSNTRSERRIALGNAPAPDEIISPKIPRERRIFERRRILSAALADGSDRIALAVGLSPDDALSCDEIFVKIENLSAQFGVTVKSMALDGKYVRPVYSNDGKDRQ